MCLCDVLSQISGDTVPLIETEIHIICNQERLHNLYVICAPALKENLFWLRVSVWGEG